MGKSIRSKVPRAPSLHFFPSNFIRIRWETYNLNYIFIYIIFLQVKRRFRAVRRAKYEPIVQKMMEKNAEVVGQVSVLLKNCPFFAFMLLFVGICSKEPIEDV